MADQRPPDRPLVTLRGGSVEAPGAPVDPPPRSVLPVLLLLALAALAVLVTSVRAPEPTPSERPVLPLTADLQLQARGVAVSLSGVLVVPVVLRNPGPLLRVRSADAYAEPVRTDPATTAPGAVAPGDSRRFVVLLEPDCRLLTPSTGLSFRASLLVVVADREGETRQLVLDLTTDTTVASVVRGLCRRT